MAAQIRAGSWMPPPKPDYRLAANPATFAELATDYYHRKRRKGLRPSSLTDMLNKLQAHLIPFFGDYPAAEIDEDLVEAYIEHKRQEQDRITAESIGRPFLYKTGRRIRLVKASTINTICTYSPGSSTAGCERG
jgi:hypothetical protein